MQEKQVLVKKKNLAVYDKVSDKIFAGGLPKVTLLFGATPYANAGGYVSAFSSRSTHGVAYASCGAKFNRNAG